MNRKVLSITLIVAIALLSFTGIVNAQEVTIRYALWDTNQLPPYQECAVAFEAANPGIQIEVELQGDNRPAGNALVQDTEGRQKELGKPSARESAARVEHRLGSVKRATNDPVVFRQSG